MREFHVKKYLMIFSSLTLLLRVRDKNTKTIPSQSTNTGPKNWVFKLGLQHGLDQHGGLDFFRKIIILSTSPPIDGPAQSFLALGWITNPFRKHKSNALRPEQVKIVNLKGRHNQRGLKSRVWQENRVSITHLVGLITPFQKS